MRRFAKPVRAYKVLQGFESPPLRFLLRLPDWRRSGPMAIAFFELARVGWASCISCLHPVGTLVQEPVSVFCRLMLLPYFGLPEGRMPS